MIQNVVSTGPCAESRDHLIYTHDYSPNINDNWNRFRIRDSK